MGGYFLKCPIDKNNNGIIINHISHALTNDRNKNLMQFGITAVQEDVLFFLWGNQDKESIYQRDIEGHLKLKTPTVTGILKRLEEKEMIIRYQDEKDARRTCHKLTKKGSDVVEHAFNFGIANMEKKIVSGLTEEEKSNLNYLLKKVLKNVEEK